MSRRLDDASAETFWPGYVDAVTNLVLNLLFVVVIMTVAVFMFAMELGRMQPKTRPEVSQNPTQAASAEAPVGPERSGAGASSATQSEALKQKEAQVAALQSRVQALESEARQRRPAGRNDVTASDSRKAAADGSQAAGQGSATGAAAEPPRLITATGLPSAPERGIEKAVPAGGPAGGIVIKFADDAVALVRSEVEDLRRALGPIAAAGGAKIEVVVPAGFSEARRLGFYRAMAVRNQLIEMKIAADRIEISVRDGSAGSDSSRVMVSPR